VDRDKTREFQVFQRDQIQNGWLCWPEVTASGDFQRSFQQWSSVSQTLLPLLSNCCSPTNIPLIAILVFEVELFNWELEDLSKKG
jgi:hypothetical protein